MDGIESFLDIDKVSTAGILFSFTSSLIQDLSNRGSTYKSVLFDSQLGTNSFHYPAGCHEQLSNPGFDACHADSSVVTPLTLLSKQEEDNLGRFYKKTQCRKEADQCCTKSLRDFRKLDCW